MDDAPAAKWKPLNRIQRRVLGVLIEKSKTTPAGYPMSLNAITTGCNQKSNRAPLMNLEPEEVEDTLEELRELGAVGVVEGGGRVSKYKHYASEWFGVSRPEGAVLAELLLRGEQTVGELRGRAARMNDTITDVAALRPILRELQSRGLVIALTPEGRGQMVTHGVFPEAEKPQGVSSTAEPIATKSNDSAASVADPSPSPTIAATSPSVSSGGVTLDMFNELQLEVAHLRAELARVKQVLDELTS